MKKKFLYALLMFFSILGLVSCDKTTTPTPTPEVTITETEIPVVGYNIVFYTFNKTKDPDTLKNQTSIPSQLPVLTVEGYEFDGWYLDVNFTNPVETGKKLDSNVTLYAKFTTITSDSTPTPEPTPTEDPKTETTPDTPTESPVVDELKDVVFNSVEEIYVKDKVYSISATNIPTGLTVEYVGNNVTGAGNHLVTANFYDAEHNLVGSLTAYIKVVYQIEFPEI